MNAGARITGCGLALLHNGLYGWTVFALLPGFLGGAVSRSLRPATSGEAAAVSAISTVFGAFFLLVVWEEGLICLLMALPLVIPMGALGGWLAYRFEPASRMQTTGIAMLPLVPVSPLWDTTARPAVFTVKTAIESAASLEQVWTQVIAFPALPEPQEWYFRAGLAYPQRARIEGTGIGAVRYCEFSTGSVRRNHRSVGRAAAPAVPRDGESAAAARMSPFVESNPKHLHGYQHGPWPAQRWLWSSDAIIHRIHLRVLNHIRTLAEHAA